MHALEVEGELLASERPTIPVPPPRESGVRLTVTRVPYGVATVDVVVCDSRRDRRSEDYVDDPSPVPSFGAPPDCGAPNEPPPSTSTVRALK
jgi:hypothetical protein